jgi:hypothetical protein
MTAAPPFTTLLLNNSMALNCHVSALAVRRLEHFVSSELDDDTIAAVAVTSKHYYAAKT